MDDEILGKAYIQVNFSNAYSTQAKSWLVTDFKFTMESTTNGETWGVFGSNSATSIGTLLLTGTDELQHVLPTYDLYDYYDFVVCGTPTRTNACTLGGKSNNNVLLGTIVADASTNKSGGLTTPLPPALPLFAGGLGLIGLIGRWCKRRQGAACDRLIAGA